MYQSLESIFAVFGIGCFLAGGIVFSIATWAYLELEKEDKQERCQLPPAPDWQKRIEEEFHV